MQKAIAVGIDKFKRNLLAYQLDELKNLAKGLNIDVIKTFSQEHRLGTPALKIGKGKAEEIQAYIQETPVTYVIFNDELTSTQIRNLEAVFDCAVIDRTLLILDIFAKRAKTKEAMLQVEIAQLNYLKPRLSALRASFEQQQGGIGQKGPGEKKLELDRRKIDRELKTLNRQLDAIVRVRKTNRKTRSEGRIRNVAIVGYTNSGKSTLLNTLTNISLSTQKQSVSAKDQLFATLETSTRRIEIKDRKPFTLTDTIGFISQLPHELIESFKSTLEEITEADLLLHVIDFSHPYYLDQIVTTNQVLDELGVDDIETLYVFNKIDLTDAILPHAFKPAIKVSLKEDTNIDNLVDHIHQLLFKDDTIAIYAIPQTRGDIIHLLNENAHVLDTTYENNTVRIKAKVDPVLKRQLKAYEV